MLAFALAALVSAGFGREMWRALRAAGVRLEFGRAAHASRHVPRAEPQELAPVEMRILPLIERDARGRAERVVVRLAFFDATGTSIRTEAGATLSWQMGGESFTRTVQFARSDFAPMAGTGPTPLLQTSPFPPIVLPPPERAPPMLAVTVHSQHMARISHVTP